MGSCVKGPNNMIVESGFGKDGPWPLSNGLVRIFVEAHSKVDLACRAKPYMDVV